MVKGALMKTFFLLTAFFLLAGCARRSESEQNIELPTGEPAFQAMGNSWVVDNAHVLSSQTVKQADSLLNRLKDEGLAEVVILVQNGVKSNPVHYAAKYGRFLRLGDSLMNTQGGNRGLVWLIRPDGETKLSVAPGDGLADLTTQDLSEIAIAARSSIYSNDFNSGVLKIAAGTDKKIRELYTARR
jgi:hypothetical protein